MSGANALSDQAVEKLIRNVRIQERRLVNLERRIAQQSVRRHQVWFPPVSQIYGGFCDSASSQTITGGAGATVISTLAEQTTESNGVTMYDDGSDSYIQVDSPGVYGVWFGGSVNNTGVTSTLVQSQLTVDSGTAGFMSRCVPRIYFRVTTSAESDTFSGVAWAELTSGQKIRLTGQSSVGDVQYLECYMLTIKLE